MGRLQLASLGEPAARSRRVLRGGSLDARAKGSPRTAKRDQRFLSELEKPQARHFFPPTRPQPHRQLPLVPLPACMRSGKGHAEPGWLLRSAPHPGPRTGRAGAGLRGRERPRGALAALVRGAGSLPGK